MKHLSSLVLVFVCLIAPLVASAETASAPVAAAPAMTDVRYAECPINGGKVLPELAVVHEAKVYHFCAPTCIEEFTKDPAAAVAKIKDAKDVLLTLTNTDGKCPVCGKATNTQFFKISGDSITCFCSKTCIGKDTVKAAPAAAPAAAFDSSAETGECGDCSSCNGCPSAGN